MNDILLLYLSAFLFAIGLAIVVIKRNYIMILLGIELMFNAANINLVVFNEPGSRFLEGQVFALFVIIVAVCEAAVGMAIILRIYHFYGTSIPDHVTDLKEKN